MVRVIVEARKAFTFCGSIWADGRPGPMAISVGAGGISGQLRLEFNKQHEGRLYIIQNNASTHFMCGESILEMYQCLYSAAFKLRRHELGVGMETMGAVLCDAFTGCHGGSPAMQERRSLWASSQNIHLSPAMPGQLQSLKVQRFLFPPLWDSLVVCVKLVLMFVIVCIFLNLFSNSVGLQFAIASVIMLQAAGRQKDSRLTRYLDSSSKG